jgi:hypothetical protein
MACLVTLFPTAAAPFLRRVLLGWSGITYWFPAVISLFLDLVPSPSMFRHGRRLVYRERAHPGYVLDLPMILQGHLAYDVVEVDAQCLE